MNDDSGPVRPAPEPYPPGPVKYLLQGIVVFSVIFAALIVVIPLWWYRLIGNCLEAGVAFVCMCICLYAYRHWSGRVILLLAAFAFGEYGLATIFWYLYTLLPLTASLGRPFVFTTVAELSFLGFMLFFIAGFQIEGKKEPVPAVYMWLLLALFLIIPLLMIDSYGITPRTVMLLVQFIVAGQLIVVTISYGFFRYPLLWAGICAQCVFSMLYGLRETLFLYYPTLTITLPPAGTAFSVYDLLSIVGPIVIASISLLTLGLLDYIVKKETTAQPA
jgi:ABC-type multidrug transport system fused ATPase/permease subunit